MAPFIGACIQSLQWADSIFIYDDHSDDEGLKVALRQSKIPVKYELSKNNGVAFKIGELRTRNYIIKRAFEELKVDVLVIADADEVFSSSLKEKITNTFQDPKVDSMAFSIWHLYNNKRYIHFWETSINKIDMIDPHTRVIRKGKFFTNLFGDGSHPILEPTINTVCLHGPYHFHLKYHQKSKLPNYSVYFLPERLTENDVKPYLRKLPFELPEDVKTAIGYVKWNAIPKYKETPHYATKRIKLKSPREALIHPKDQLNNLRLERGKDILLFYEKQKWDYVENYSKRSISGFYAWYTLMVKALRRGGYRVHENNYELALANPRYPIGIVGTPQIIGGWKLQNPSILGPSMYDNPAQNPNLMKNRNFKYYLLTCEWLKKVFERTYGKKCVLWHAGIPTDEWKDTKEEKKTIDVLIYNKIRWGKESVTKLILEPIEEYLAKKGLVYYELKYGNITHEEYKELLKKSKSMIFLCEHETQGIAYQEALASNIPIIAWDHGWWTDPVWQAYSKKPIPTTSVPLFSKECGEKFKMISEFPKTFDKFWTNLKTYRPRDYIIKTISLKKSARQYTKYYFSI